jgi:hypothetical protein
VREANDAVAVGLRHRGVGLAVTTQGRRSTSQWNLGGGVVGASYGRLHAHVEGGEREGDLGLEREVQRS